MGWRLENPNMYVRTENDEIIEVRDGYHHPYIIKPRGNLYGRPKVKPVDGTSSWQLFSTLYGGDKETCIATFDTVKDANEALRSFNSDLSEGQGWDAIEYKKGNYL